MAASDLPENEAHSADPGRVAYESAMGVEFVPEAKVQASTAYGFKTRVIPSAYPVGVPAQLRGARVAVVGNGPVETAGGDIDSHDEVIRISAMRRWSGDPKVDGCRTTLWAGQLAFVAADGVVERKFRRLVEDGVPLWALSRYHVTCDAYNFLRNRPTPPNVTVLPAAESMLRTFSAYMTPEDVGLLSGLAPARFQLPGFSRYELLLTGTRLVLALEAAGVHGVSLFGFDLFTSQARRPWQGHDIPFDREVLRRVRTRFQASGRAFRWIPEPA